MSARETQGAPSIEHLCQLGGVSRARFYRFGEVRAPERTKANLRQNPNDRARNLTRGLIPTGLDQFWVADITYVWLAGQFVHLAVVLDAFSRRVIGWALTDHLEASLAIEALDIALTARKPKAVLFHHSDRDVHYASTDYCYKPAGRGVLISMSRAGNPCDNAKAERFMRTLKEEEVNGKTHTSVEEAGGPYRRLPRKRLQSKPPAFRARLQRRPRATLNATPPPD